MAEANAPFSLPEGGRGEGELEGESENEAVFRSIFQFDGLHANCHVKLDAGSWYLGGLAIGR